MKNVLVTGLGLVSCLGRQLDTIARKLKHLEHGFQVYTPFTENPKIPVSVAAPVPEFETNSTDPEDWIFPSELRFRLEQLRALSPNALYAHFALRQAVENAGLELSEISGPSTGLFTASSGSAMLTHYHLDRFKKHGPMRCSPMGIVASIAGTLNFNLSAAYKIKGSSTGFVSACASSGHALGYAHDEIALGRQDRMIVVGAEDFTEETIGPFAAMRVLSTSTDPDSASRPFDQNRDGFVGTGGACAIILESQESAEARNARILASFDGWGQATDGHHVAISHPEGEGLKSAMDKALKSASWQNDSVDYINAHATSTQTGDVSECKAIKAIFDPSDCQPCISSTKALTGHALSLSSILEAAFSIISMNEGFMPGSAHIENLIPEAEGLNILRETKCERPKRILSNSSGFGGANVSLAFSSID